MNDLQVFDFNSRTVRVVDRDGEPWWVAADVCQDDRGISNVDTPSGTQEMLIINESGLYSLILTSRKAEAKLFKRWVTSDVLPALRKTGFYSAHASEDPLVTQARLHLETVQRQVELERAQREQQRQIDELKTQVGLTSTHMTLMGWCSTHGISLSRAEAAREGRFVARLCREKGLASQKVADVRYGRVNAYPVEVLAEWLELYRQPVG